MSIEENLRLMKTLDDAWNAQDWNTFNKRHTEDVVVKWPGQSEPTRGIKAHQNEGVEMFKTFPDNHVENNPYKVLFGQGDWTCSIAIFRLYVYSYLETCQQVFTSTADLVGACNTWLRK